VSPPRDERAGHEPVNPFIDPRAGSILGNKRGRPRKRGQAQTDREGEALLGWIHRPQGGGVARLYTLDSLKYLKSNFNSLRLAIQKCILLKIVFQMSTVFINRRLSLRIAE